MDRTAFLNHHNFSKFGSTLYVKAFFRPTQMVVFSESYSQSVPLVVHPSSIHLGVTREESSNDLKDVFSSICIGRYIFERHIYIYVWMWMDCHTPPSWRGAGYACCHTSSTAPDPIRTRKLSGEGPGQYWGGYGRI